MCVVSLSAFFGHEELLTVNETAKIFKMVTALIIVILFLLLWHSAGTIPGCLLQSLKQIFGFVMIVTTGTSHKKIST